MEFQTVLEYVTSCVDELSERPLTSVEQAILRWTWEGLSYKAMAKRMGYSATTLKSVYGYELWQFLKQIWPEERISKPTFKKVMLAHLNRFTGSTEKSSSLDRGLRLPPDQAGIDSPIQARSAQDLYRDGGLDLDQFPLSGYEELIDRLQTHIFQGCRVVILTGAAGVGKTALLSRLVKRLLPQYDDYLCRRVSNIPAFEDWYQDWLGLSAEENDRSNILSEPLTSAQQIRQVFAGLQQKRYLLVLDQTEAFYQSTVGEFSSVSQGYRELLQRMATEPHLSCLIWVGQIEPTHLPRDRRVVVETLSGVGLPPLGDEGQGRSVESYAGSDWQYVAQMCGENPRLWQAALDQIDRWQSGQGGAFRQRPLVRHSNLTMCLKAMVAHLSEGEWGLIYWLALHPLSLEDLRLWPTSLALSPRQREAAWDRLQQRYLLRSQPHDPQSYRLHPPLLCFYAIEQLLHQLTQELKTEQLDKFHQYPLDLTTASWQDQTLQRQQLLSPLADALWHDCGGCPTQVTAKLRRLLTAAQQSADCDRSCAAGNLLNLALQLEMPLEGQDWTGLTFWYANLSVARLHQVDFSNCRFQSTQWASGLTHGLRASLHPQGDWLAIGDVAGRLNLYKKQRDRWTLINTGCVPSALEQLLITPHGGLIVITADQQVYLWESMQSLSHPFRQRAPAAITTVAISPDEESLALGLIDGRILLWDWLVDASMTEMAVTGSAVKAIHFCPEGRFLSSYDGSDVVLMWDLQNTTVPIRSLALDPYGIWLDWSWQIQPLDRSAQEIDPTLGPLSDEGTGTLPALELIEYLPDPMTGRGWVSTTTGTEPFAQEVMALQTARLSRNGRYLALVSCDRTVQLWQRYPLVQISSFTLNTLPETVLPTDDGRYLLCQTDGHITLWATQSAVCLQQITAVLASDLYKDCMLANMQGVTPPEQALAVALGASTANTISIKNRKKPHNTVLNNDCTG